MQNSKNRREGQSASKVALPILWLASLLANQDNVSLSLGIGNTRPVTVVFTSCLQSDFMRGVDYKSESGWESASPVGHHS